MMAEDHNSARQAYVSMLREEYNFMVTGHAGNGYELLKLIEQNEPDIVLTDLEMPVMNGSKLIEVLRVRFPRIKTIVLSMYSEAEYISQLIVHGACAYLPKKCDFEEVVFTINRVFAEGYYFNRAISRIIVSSATDRLSGELELSPREIDVLKLICDEKSNKEIADRLRISITTVMYHRRNIFEKTNSESAIGLYKYALRKGIVEPGN